MRGYLSTYGICIGYIELLSAPVAARSAVSLPAIPQWLGTQQNNISFFCSLISNIFLRIAPINGFFKFLFSMDCIRERESVKMIYLLEIGLIDTNCTPTRDIPCRGVGAHLGFLGILGANYPANE